MRLASLRTGPFRQRPESGEIAQALKHSSVTRRIIMVRLASS